MKKGDVYRAAYRGSYVDAITMRLRRSYLVDPAVRDPDFW
jgi:hypothetical protein